MNLSRSEFKRAFEKAGFIIESIEPVENMPILYKFRFFRAKPINRKKNNRKSPSCRKKQERSKKSKRVD